MEEDIIDTSEVEILVLDEADRMLEFGMLEDVTDILKKLPKTRQNMLFSATMPDKVKKLATALCKNPVHVKTAHVKAAAPKIQETVYLVEETHKAELLIDFLRDHSNDSVLVFVRTRKKADTLAKAINVSHIRTRALHGDLGQIERSRVLQMFKNGEIKVLIATDVAARGIDIDGLSHVVNFNTPNIPETYTHRIGRTGRAGETGTAITYCSSKELPFLTEIEKLRGAKIKRK